MSSRARETEMQLWVGYVRRQEESSLARGGIHSRRQTEVEDETKYMEVCGREGPSGPDPGHNYNPDVNLACFPCPASAPLGCSPST